MTYDLTYVYFADYGMSVPNIHDQAGSLPL